MKFSQLFIKEIIFFSLFMPFFSSLVIAMEEEKTLVLPHPRKLYLGPLRNNSRKEEIGALIKEGVTLKFSNPTVHKLQEAIGLFEKAAEQGNIQGMFFIGKTCEEKGKLELAVRWYTLAFQNQWFQDPIGASKSLSYNSLKKLENEPRIEIQNFLMIHTFDIDSSVKKVGRYCSLIDFYKKKTAEPHLNDEENQLKIKRLDIEMRLIFDYACEIAKNFFNSGIKFVEKKLYKEAPNCFLKSSWPDALYNLGWLFEEGHIEGQPNYQKAIEYYDIAKTTMSFASLGRLYKNGKCGPVEGKPNYEKAMMYLKCSGHPVALSHLGILFKEGYIGQKDGQPDYQTAKSYFGRSATDDAHVRLGELYMLGYIGDNSPQPDYQQAVYYFRMAADRGYPNACCKLGHLYLQGYIGSVYGEPDYKTAVEYFEKASQSSDPYIKSNAYYNLGVTYVKGYLGQIPDYKKAKVYFAQSTLPEAPYNIGNLYELGHIGTTSQKPDYKKAVEYYDQSNTPRAQIAILGLYQLGYVKPSGSYGKQQVIDNIIKKINQQLHELPIEESYYIKGIAEYYLGNWEEAFISLQNALAFGNDEEELSQLIEEIGVALIEEVRKEKEEQEPKIELISEPVKKEIQVKDNIELKHETLIIAPVEKEKLEKKVEEMNKSQIIFPKKEKLTKERKSILKAYQAKKKFLSFMDEDLKGPKFSKVPLQFEFLTPEDKSSFENIKVSHSKLQEILQDIQDNCWATIGVGKPEVLKYSFKGHKGCLARRLNDEDRLVYKVVKPGIILILSWEGHYM